MSAQAYKSPEGFTSQVPEHLLHGKTESEKWMYHQQDIQRQQLTAVLLRLQEGEQRFEEADAAREEVKRNLKQAQIELGNELKHLADRIEPFEKWRERWMGKKSVLNLLFIVLGYPLFMTLLGALALRAFEKWWK